MNYEIDYTYIFTEGFMVNQLTDKEIKEVKNHIFLKTLLIGFFGGIIWSTLLVLLYVFKMIDINPMILFRTVLGDRLLLTKWYMYVLLIIVIGIISIVLAIAYYVTLKKFKSWMIGGAYGILIWGLLMLLLPLTVNGVSSLSSYNSQTYIGSFCVLLLYGIFVGYSISFEYQYTIEEQAKR